MVAKHSPYSYSTTPNPIKIPQKLGLRRTTPVAGVRRTNSGVRRTTPRGTNPGVRLTPPTARWTTPQMDRAVSKCSTWTGGLQMNKGPSKRTGRSPAGQGAPQPLQGTGRSFCAPNGQSGLPTGAPPTLQMDRAVSKRTRARGTPTLQMQNGQRGGNGQGGLKWTSGLQMGANPPNGQGGLQMDKGWGPPTLQMDRPVSKWTRVGSPQPFTT